VCLPGAGGDEGRQMSSSHAGGPVQNHYGGEGLQEVSQLGTGFLRPGDMGGGWCWAAITRALRGGRGYSQRGHVRGGMTSEQVEP